ncbi:leucine-rich repeat-containing protein 74B-like isoform X3 [Dysidea avara]|uniref:leucine-rich repeat-containing protein 74B-like isoform X3 n=1 Tax=Dysidea avara TaxID=196820 RepID=UPI00332361AF
MGNSITKGEGSYVDTTTEVFQHFYPQLTEFLPMNDIIFLSKLFLANLPEDHVKPGDIREQTHFQNSVIKPSVTFTELYQLFIVTTLQKQVKNDDKPTHLVDSELEKILCETWKGIPKQVVGMVFCLSKLAFCGFFDWHSEKDSEGKIPKVVYTIEDLIQCGLKVTDHFYGLLKVANTDQLPTDNVTFSFAHFTIQNFMCALYITTLPQEEQEHLLNENYHYYSNVVVFWSGLVSSKAVQFITDQFKYDVCITAVQCVYESRQANLVQPSEPFRLDFDYCTLSLYECLAASTVLSHHPVEDLCMVESHVGDEGIRMLLSHLNEDNSGHPLEMIDLTDNNLTVVGAKLLLKIVMNSSVTLNSMDVSSNPIGDDGISLLIEGMKGNKVLENLSADNCEITIKGVCCIAEFLKSSNQSLEILSLCSNKIGDDGVSMIVDALQGNNTLTQLMMDQCEISVKGATYIAELIRTKSTLDVLALDANNLGDDGITAIAGSLGKSKIDKLMIEECGITLTGAKALAESLLINKTITLLSLSKNAITVEGARAIFESAVGNGTLCPRVIMDSHLYEDDDEAQLLMEVLQMRWKRQYLKRCREHDDEDSNDDDSSICKPKKFAN